jgi:sialic acid synthase
MTHTFIVAEIGQNHNGSVQTARELIDMAARCKVDAVKFCKRDIDSCLTPEQQARPYHCPQSYGKTYGEHRHHLELTMDEHRDLKLYAESKDLLYFASVCDLKSLELMMKLDIEIIKIASRDINNIPLIKAAAQTGEELFLSIGMATDRDVDRVLRCIYKVHRRIIILNCTSEYPTQYPHLHLNRIPYLQARFGPVKVGHSDHTIGIVMPVCAVALGASVIEKHITLSRASKGTDHVGSLEELGLMRMVRDIRHLEEAMGDFELPTELPAYVKKGRIYQTYVKNQEMSK